MEQLQQANIDSFKDLEEVMDRYNMLVSSYNLDQRIIQSLTKSNKEWSIIYSALEDKALNQIMKKIEKIEKLENIIKEKELTIEKIEEQLESYHDNSKGSEDNNYDRD